MKTPNIITTLPDEDFKIFLAEMDNLNVNSHTGFKQFSFYKGLSQADQAIIEEEIFTPLIFLEILRKGLTEKIIDKISFLNAAELDFLELTQLFQIYEKSEEINILCLQIEHIVTEQINSYEISNEEVENG